MKFFAAGRLCLTQHTASFELLPALVPPPRPPFNRFCYPPAVTMGKSVLKKNKVVIVLQGRFAGRKAVIVKLLDGDATSGFKRALGELR